MQIKMPKNSVFIHNFTFDGPLIKDAFDWLLPVACHFIIIWTSKRNEILEAIGKIKIKATVPTVDTLQWLIQILSVFYYPEQNYPKPAEVYDGQSFDFIIVGGGTAGCVVANRLTEIPKATVLLVEYGDIPDLISDVPGFFPVADTPDIIWKYESINDGYTSQAHKTKNIRIDQGKMLGGTSGINYLVYLRGMKEDYDNWGKGNEGWDWNELLTYFKKAENFKSISDINCNSSCLHGTEGYLGVTQLRWRDKTEKYLKAFKENGHEILEDINDFKNNMGYGEGQFTIDNDIRQSTAVAYIRPIKNRYNLKIILNSLVTNIVIKDKKAVGVEIKQKNKNPIFVKAKKEVIISCGAFNTPKLLMLSGIGPKSDLEKHRIDVIHDSPNVGKNLLDNPFVSIGLTGEKNLLSEFENLDVVTSIKSFPTPFLIGRVALDGKNKKPDYQMSIFPLPANSPIPSVFCEYVLGLDAKICATQRAAGIQNEVLYAANVLLHQKSRGRVELLGKDPHTPPAIYLGYYTEEEDLERHAQCLENYVTLINTTYFEKHGGEIVYQKIKKCDSLTFPSREYWKCYALNMVDSMWDYTGTCKMGDEGVVDSRLKVNGVENLRVVDASVIPISISSANINAVVIMVAEKASDIIKVDNGFIKKEEKDVESN